MHPIVVILGTFTVLSVMALGGGTAVLPELHKMVHHYGWLTDRQFVDLYAISNITPGPTMLFVCIIGYEAGLKDGPAMAWLGMAAATLGMFGPSSLLTYYVRGVWDKFERSEWRHAIEKGLAPVGVGLLLSGAHVVAKTACTTPITIGIALATTALVTFTRINLLWIMAAAGLLGYLDASL